ncbi:hypothetical protein GQ457_18G010780 [Hibiscus cannabinus]
MADLINPTNNEWNIDLIKSLFTPSVTNKILCIPLTKSKPPDVLVWGIEGSGLYTPKSGYRLLLGEEIQASRGNIVSNNHSFSEFFKQRTLIVITCRALWYARNQLLYEGERPSIPKISAFILAHVAELKGVVAIRHPSMPPIISSWFPPASGTIKFNFDTSLTSSTKEAFSGVVARNSTSLIMKITFSHVGRQGNEAAHVLAKPITVSSFPDTGLKKHRWKSNGWPFVTSDSRFKLQTVAVWSNSYLLPPYTSHF